MARKKAKKGKLGVTGRIVLIGNILAGTGLILSYLSLYFSPEKNWLLPFFGLLYPYLLLVNIIFSLYWALRFRIYFLISLVTILIGWNLIRRTVQMEVSTAPLTAGKSFQVMTYNVRNMSNNNLLIPDPEVRDAIVELLVNNRPDILCLQEFEAVGENPLEFIESMAQALGLPYYEFARYNERSTKRIDAIITFSRFPMITGHALKKDVHRNYCLINDLLIGKDTVRLYNIHLESVRFRHEDYTFINDLDLQFEENENIKEGSRRVFNKLKAAYILRSQQVKSLSLSMEHSPFPVIVCGDFNDTPCSYSYQVLSRAKKDAFMESGSGLGNTYAGTLPSLRIDYILYDRKFRSFAYTTGREKLSDHYPVAATLGYRRVE